MILRAWRQLSRIHDHQEVLGLVHPGTKGSDSMGFYDNARYQLQDGTNAPGSGFESEVADQA